MKLNEPYTSRFAAAVNTLCAQAQPPLQTSYITESGTTQKDILIQISETCHNND